jgi:putative ABC transport system permease protein
MDGLRQDLLYALRTLTRDRGTTLLVVLTLALGIGANTAIFSALSGSLFAALPYAGADELVMVWLDNERLGIKTDITSYPNYQDTRDQAQTLRDLGVYNPTWVTFTDGEPERVRASRVSANVFPILGVEPARGRAFEPEEDLEGREPAVILGDGLWKRRFGGDPDLVGKRIEADGTAYTVAGIMPPEFDFPGDAELWLPMALGEGRRTSRGSFWLYQIGRLRPGTTVESAQRDMDAAAAKLVEANPRMEGYGLYVQSLREHLVGEVETPLLVLSAAVVLVLLIACSNVAHLLLARSAARDRELTVRMVLGAGRRRLIRQLLTESVVLALLGGGLGVALAVFGLGALVRLGPEALTRLGTPQLDAPVLAFSLALSLAAGLLVGLLPALQVSATALADALKEGGRGAAGRRGWLRRALVAVEVALALTLLVGAGLLLRSFGRLLAVDRGFTTAGVLTANVSLPRQTYPEDARVVAFYRDFLDRVGALPGVEAVGATSTVLLPQLARSGNLSIEGVPDPPDEKRIEVTFDAVVPGFFETLAIPLLAGRPLSTTDDAEATPVSVVNEAMARRYWDSAENAVGRRFKFGDQDDDGTWYTVAGVVGDARRTSLEKAARPSAYFPHPQVGFRSMTVVVRARGDLSALAAAMRRTLREIDPGLPLFGVAALDEAIGERMAPRRFHTVLLTAFAGLALFLSLVGIYGVIAQWVGEKTREIGVRMALGADRGDVVRWVLAQGLMAPLIGLGVGLALSVAVSRALASLLFEVGTLDPATFAAVPVVVLAVAAAAVLWPALRACRVHPSRALRYE